MPSQGLVIPYVVEPTYFQMALWTHDIAVRVEALVAAERGPKLDLSLVGEKVNWLMREVAIRRNGDELVRSESKRQVELVRTFVEVGVLPEVHCGGLISWREVLMSLLHFEINGKQLGWGGTVLVHVKWGNQAVIVSHGCLPLDFQL
jgi:hypothetical protein